MTTSFLHRETKQTADIAVAQLQNSLFYISIADHVRGRDIKMVYLLGRGSSYHAAHYSKYLIETSLGLPCCIGALASQSVFQSGLKLANTLVIAFSQSGESPDIIETVVAAKSAGAFCIAAVNQSQSPLAKLCHEQLPIMAGDEHSVAASKSYLASLLAITRLCALLSEDHALIVAIDKINTALVKQNDKCYQGLALPEALKHGSGIILGRGFGHAMAGEMALKIQEVLGRHVQAISSAEFMHGPFTLIYNDVLMLELSVDDLSQKHHSAVIDRINAEGKAVYSFERTENRYHPLINNILTMHMFYLNLDQTAQHWGRNPDAPQGLQKITKTH